MNKSMADLLDMMDFSNGEKCLLLLSDNAQRLLEAPGSSHNHQAWPGGYLDHVLEVMNIATALYASLSEWRSLPFKLPDALLVLFLHDLEKPWKKDFDLKAKTARALFREKKIAEYEFALTPEQQNALAYVEGEGDDYSSSQRVMNEMAAFCHACDVISARIWHNFPTKGETPEETLESALAKSERAAK